jgi:hypothetical protein
MKIFISIIYIVLFSFITSFSFANDKYGFHLKIITDDNSIKSHIESSVLKNLKKFKNIEIKKNLDFRDGVPVVILYIYGKKHENSNIDKQIITFTIAHTSNTEFMNLMAEVFGDDKFDDSSDRMKAITSDLLINKKAILKYLNVASIDNLGQIDIVTQSILKSLSIRIENYYIK